MTSGMAFRGWFTQQQLGAPHFRGGSCVDGSELARAIVTSAGLDRPALYYVLFALSNCQITPNVRRGFVQAPSAAGSLWG
jgi:hypothetical protein